MDHTRTNTLGRLILLCLLIFASITMAGAQDAAKPQTETKAAPSASGVRGALWSDIPQRIDIDARYLFYLHGRIIENQGVKAVSPRFGAYEYEAILQTFVDNGFIVISEPRPNGTDVQQYAAKVVRQIYSLLEAGVAPQKITVVGASKGGSIAAATSAQLRNRDVTFVLLAACGNSHLYGNILSVWDYRDDTGAATCKRSFAQAAGVNRHKEVEVRLGLGHGILYRPLKEWVDLVIEWANQK
ncbi:hypothetical protein BH20ACI3_BH20ACI3_06120 [soil metagenome]